MRLLRLMFQSRTRLAAANLFLRRQLACYIERQVRPHRMDNASRIALVLLSHCVDAAGLRVKLGLTVSPRTVRRYMPSRPRRREGRSAQSWATFLRNHAGAVLACDFFIVVTATFQRLYVFGCSLCPRDPRARPSTDRPRGGHGASDSGLDGTTTSQCMFRERRSQISPSRSRFGLCNVSTTIAGMNTHAVRRRHDRRGKTPRGARHLWSCLDTHGGPRHHPRRRRGKIHVICAV